AADPIHKTLVGRDPIDGEALASQPTVSRFENAVGRGELFRMGEALADVVIERHRKRLRGRARYITIDLDPTEDPTHGEQQLSFFNGYYDGWCYLPVVGFLTFNHEPEQYLFTALLRPGNAPDKRGALPILERILRRLRVAFPRARFCVRLDAGFAAPEIFSFLDAHGDVDYAVAMPSNAVLLRRIKELQLGLEMDRTSCSSFWANQLRVLLTSAAYVLMQELRLRAARTSCARAQVQTLRERLIKIGARVVESVRRVVLHLPASYPFL